MKILYISDDDKEVSGWGRYTKSVLEEASERLIPYSYFGLKNVLSKSSLNKVISLPWSLVMARKLAKSCDIVHVFDVWPFAIWGYISVLGTGKKLFITAIGSYSIPPREVSIKRFLMVNILKRAEKIFSISNYTKKRLLESIDLSNVVTVYMGSPKVVYSSDNNKTRNLLNITNEAGPIILTVGQIKHRKGQLDTVKAVSVLKNEYQNILYLIVGNDSDQEYVSRINTEIVNSKIETNIRIISNLLSDKDLAAVYNLADVFCLNSNNDSANFEGFGLVFLEAAQAGKPVIGSKDCGIEDAMVDGFNGYYTEQGNHGDIIEKIRMVLKVKDELGKNSLEFSKRFSWVKTVNIYREQYDLFFKKIT